MECIWFKLSQNGSGSNETKESRAQQSENKIKLVTWNIDGLDEEDLLQRITEVCSTIKRLQPDIVFLQEVIFDIAPLIVARCPGYKLFPTRDEQYFTAMMLKTSTVTIQSNIIMPFENTTMGRRLHKVKVKCAGLNLLLMNSHLESMKEKTVQRKQQFQIALEEMASASDDTVVLFGGDTNLRDREVSEMGDKIPGGIFDLWELFGCPEDAKYTWDTERNDNKELPFPNKPRLRFDRLYLRQAKTAPKVSLQSFKLIGEERIAAVDCFPSDHFGIFCEFKVN
ncbi:tyrosyl-DNA phosphodiesterase 2-like [Anneissia japonica]|uniref:tyrosyl-DNA phosphodiesterase 2-like n=1 Tax=Anneissia japonica TaxID=1529436 RepID=UPI0014258FB4|nr:tyrosyl-DNA phosphodiesterase 2-like [Anneissia japonica]